MNQKQKERAIKLLKPLIMEIKRELKEETGDIIQKTLAMIKSQIGLDLTLDDYFTGIRYQADNPVFYVELKQRTSESSEYDKLLRFANKYKLIRVEPAGVRRLAIFPQSK